MRRLLSMMLGPVGAEQDVAWRRAEQLLQDSLTATQFSDYQAHGYVEIASPGSPDRTYRIDGWRPVAVYERGQFAGAVCINSKEHLPGPDLLLARKLMIEGAEPDFLTTGNWLKPTWRPAGAAPVLFLVFALLSPWLFYLRELGPWGLAVGLLLVAAPITVVARRVRRGRTVSRA